MTISLITFPKFKLTLGTTTYENIKVRNFKVIRNENGFDIATIELNDTSLYPGTVTTGTATQLEVGEKGTAYPTNPMFKGICRFPVINLGNRPSLTLSCLGSGYGLGQMLVGTEYGAQSKNPTIDTITEIITDTNHGVIPRYVNRVFEAGASGDSGFNYDISDVDTINDSINYAGFPYKPADKAINDLVDRVTALKDGSAGPHWIVTTDNHFRMKLITSTQSGEWSKYYGGDTNAGGQATLEYGESYKESNFETVGPEAQYILYYGQWRKPSNGDAWTEDDADDFWSQDFAPFAVTFSADSTAIVGGKSLKVHAGLGGTTGYIYKALGTVNLQTASIASKYIPRVEFYARRSSGATALTIEMIDTYGTKHFSHDIFPDLTAADHWYHFSLPIGPYYDTLDETKDFVWETLVGVPSWSTITRVGFYMGLPNGEDFYIDGFHLSGVPVCRVAYNSGKSPYAMKLITDDIGKDDSLVANDDSGVMAQMNYAELLRAQKTTVLGWVKLKGIIPEALPGQWFNHGGNDMRATKLVHEMNEVGFYTTPYLTDDLTNGKARMRYEDLNKIYADMRPEWQDRQASSIKAGQVDFNVPRLVVDYA